MHFVTYSAICALVRTHADARVCKNEEIAGFRGVYFHVYRVYQKKCCAYGAE